MRKPYGNIAGLKPEQLRKLENFYRRRIPDIFIITPDLARDITRLSLEIHRQIGLLVNRSGKIVSVIVGDAEQIVIPDTPDYRTLPGRLKGIRCIHTHLKDKGLDEDDLTDLALLRLDLMAALTIHPDGGPQALYAAHILPKAASGKPYQVLDPLRPNQFDAGCKALIRALDEELAQLRAVREASSGTDRAILVSVTHSSPAHSA